MLSALVDVVLNNVPGLDNYFSRRVEEEQARKHTNPKKIKK